MPRRSEEMINDFPPDQKIRTEAIHQSIREFFFGIRQFASIVVCISEANSLLPNAETEPPTDQQELLAIVDQPIVVESKVIKSQSPQLNEEKTGYLDLIVDFERRTIRRKGYDAIVDLSRCNRLWETFLVMFKSEDRDCTFDAWRNAVKGEDDSVNLRQHKKRLNEKLRDLGITIPRGQRKLAHRDIKRECDTDVTSR